MAFIFGRNKLGCNLVIFPNEKRGMKQSTSIPKHTIKSRSTSVMSAALYSRGTKVGIDPFRLTSYRRLSRVFTLRGGSRRVVGVFRAAAGLPCVDEGPGGDFFFFRSREVRSRRMRDPRPSGNHRKEPRWHRAFTKKWTSATLALK